MGTEFHRKEKGGKVKIRSVYKSKGYVHTKLTLLKNEIINKIRKQSHSSFILLFLH